MNIFLQDRVSPAVGGVKNDFAGSINSSAKSALRDARKHDTNVFKFRIQSEEESFDTRELQHYLTWSIERHTKHIWQMTLRTTKYIKVFVSEIYWTISWNFNMCAKKKSSNFLNGKKYSYKIDFQVNEFNKNFPLVHVSSICKSDERTWLGPFLHEKPVLDCQDLHCIAETAHK